MGPKKGPKMGTKGGPKMGPPEVGTKKKVEKCFFSGPTAGGYTGPPLPKTRFCRGFGHPNHAIAEFEKKCGNPPRRMVQRGGFPHFFSKIGDNMVWGGETFLKNWPKRGAPLF